MGKCFEGGKIIVIIMYTFFRKIISTFILCSSSLGLKKHLFKNKLCCSFMLHGKCIFEFIFVLTGGLSHLLIRTKQTLRKIEL